MGNCCSQRELCAERQQSGADAGLHSDSKQLQQAAQSWEQWLRADGGGDRGSSSTSDDMRPITTAESATLLQAEMMRLKSENAVLKGQLGMGRDSSSTKCMTAPPGLADAKESPVYVLPGGVLRSAVEANPSDQQLDSNLDWRTTVMLRNLPNNYTRDMIMGMLDKEGFTHDIDFLYLPIDFQSGASLGYAFVNCTSADTAQRMWDVFVGYSQWVLPSKKACIVSWSDPHQGLAANVDRYRNSPIMHPLVPDEHKPVVLMSGKRIPFLPPTKKLKPPRMRRVETDRRAAFPTGSSLGSPIFSDHDLFYQGFIGFSPAHQMGMDESWDQHQYAFMGDVPRARAHSG